MNVEDLAAFPEGASIDTDVCIVGSGPAGLTIARELNETGARILVLESGGREREPWIEALNTIENVGAERVLDQGEVRNRVVGGTSATWQGRTATFDEMDFADRAWVPFSGWPISREELRPYFARSAPHLGIAIPDNNRQAVIDVYAARCPRLDDQVFRHYAWSYSRHDSRPSDYMRFGPQALEHPIDHVRCVVHATVTHIDTNETGDAVRQLEVHGTDGRRRWVTARVVVLCGGGIENARLLLASNRIVKGGVGNAHDMVGRFIMDHPRGPVAYFKPADFVAAQRLFGEFRLRPGTLAASGMTDTRPRRPARMIPGYALTPEFQRTEELLNCAMFLSSDVAADDPIDAAQDLVRMKRPWSSFRHIVRRPGMVAEGVKRVVRDERLALRSLSSVRMECILEQRPDPDSRITLSDRTDALGMPISVIDWRISDLEAQTARRATAEFIAEMRRLRLPVPELVPMFEDWRTEFFLPACAHPTGTTRMSSDPATGVVNADCAVHGVDGLYVAGSSVFPTSGHANPTQMIVSLAVRLADHLKTELSRRRPAAAALQADS